MSLLEQINKDIFYSLLDFIFRFLFYWLYEIFFSEIKFIFYNYKLMQKISFGSPAKEN